MAIDREALIEALERMDNAEDAEAAAAAREATAMMDAADLTWEDVIDKGLGQEAAASGPQPELGEDDHSVMKAIDAMLARPNLNETTAEDLKEYREELERGELEPEDRRYVLTLYERLG